MRFWKHCEPGTDSFKIVYVDSSWKPVRTTVELEAAAIAIICLGIQSSTVVRNMEELEILAESDGVAVRHLASPGRGGEDSIIDLVPQFLRK